VPRRRGAPQVSGPLDLALERLRTLGLPYGWDERDLRVWHAVCPSCRAPEWGLRVREGLRGGPISLICAGGCSDVDAALAADPTVAELADLKARLALAVAAAETAGAIAREALEIAANRTGMPEDQRAAA
jgi:hypothetical protein